MAGLGAVVPPPVNVSAAAGKRLRADRHLERMGRSQLPRIGLRRRDGGTIHHHRKTGRVAGHGHLRGRPAVKPLDPIDIAGAVAGEAGKLHARRNGVEHRAAIAGERERNVHHHRRVIEQRQILVIIGQRGEIALGALDDVVIIDRDVGAVVRPGHFMVQPQHVPHFVQQCTERAGNRAGRHLLAANTPDIGFALAAGISGLKIEIDIIGLAAQRHELNHVRERVVERG